MTADTITSLRIGHATNSSSSHSVVIAPSGHRIRGEEPKWDANDFGWDNFTLTSVEDKVAYLAVTRRDGYPTFDEFRAAYGEFVPEKRLAAIYGGGGYVDHDSVGIVDNEMLDLLKQPEVIILGGNDNSDGHPLAEEYPRLPGGVPRIRKDGPATIYYWRENGLKVRFGPASYTKASAPELVDIKITDYCPYGCAFCYQDSTKAGAHGDLDQIKRIIDRLAELDVFEIAIGGGEPVLHPEFPEIVRYAHERGITPNVTVFGVEWLEKPAIVEAVKSFVGGVGVSVHRSADLSKVARIKDAIGYRHYVVAQHVVGSDPGLLELARAVAQEWGGKLLLLGYKSVGRGGRPAYPVPRGEMEEVLRIVRHANDMSLSVDTAFLDQYPGLDIPKVLTTSPEGKFSCYIDAVAGKIAPSSYCAASEYLPLRLDAIREDFAKF